MITSSFVLQFLFMNLASYVTTYLSELKVTELSTHVSDWLLSMELRILNVLN